jgi:hypothetical protein
MNTTEQELGKRFNASPYSAREFHVYRDGWDAAMEYVKAGRCPHWSYGTDGVHAVVVNKCAHPETGKWSDQEAASAKPRGKTLYTFETKSGIFKG